MNRHIFVGSKCYKVFHEVYIKFRGGAFGDEGVHLCAQGVLVHLQNP